MSVKKGYCIHCNKHDEVRRIFDVNPDARNCHCPHCGHKYRPKIAIQNYERVISHYLRRANYYLKNTGNPKASYALFAYVLELDPNNKQAKLGRLLSLAYLSSLRRNRFLEVKELLLMDNDSFRGVRMRRDYAAFLISLHKCVSDYMVGVKKKLTFKEYFYDVNCLKLYYGLLSDAMNLLRTVVDELSIIEEEKTAETVNDTIKQLEHEYNVSFFTVDGQEQRLVNFTKTGEPLIVNGKTIHDTSKLQRYRMASLNDEKNYRKINDIVFTRKFLKMHQTIKASLSLIILIGLLAIASLVLYFIFMKNALAIIALISAITFGAIALTLLIIRLIFQYVLRKPRL